MATTDKTNPDTATTTMAQHANSANRANRIGLWALGLGFGSFMLWAALAPLGEGVPAQGHITIDTKRKPVQYLSGGILKEVLVGEGALVKEGQVLARMDDGTVKANFEAVRQRYLSLRTMQGRLMAEQAGQRSIQFHPDLQAASQDPLIAQQMRNQELLLHSRQNVLRADVQAIEENIQGIEASIAAQNDVLLSRRNQLALLTEELNNTRSLVKDGYVPRNRQLELERMVSESNSFISDLQGNIMRAKRSIGEQRQRAIQRQQEYRKEIETQMADVTREVQGDAEKFRAAQDDLERTEIRSPASGQVVSLIAQASGAVLAPGQKLMDIVPTDQALTLEAHVSPQVIDRVHAGMSVDVRFSAFAHSPQLVVPGTVMSISADILADSTNTPPYFLARVTVTPEGLKILGKRQMQPGMPVDVVFKTGERSMLTYLLHPLTKRVAASMTEE